MSLKVEYPCGCVRQSSSMKLCEEHERLATERAAHTENEIKWVVWLVLAVLLVALAYITR
jgi:hypothetical protein